MFGLDPAGELTLGGLALAILAFAWGVLTSRQSDRGEDRDQHAQDRIDELENERDGDLRIEVRRLKELVVSLRRQLRKCRADYRALRAP